MICKHKSALLVVAVLSGCQTGAVNAPFPAAPSVFHAPHVLTAAETAAVQAGLKSSLKDPDSARFEGFSAVEDKADMAIVCGYVNAKNSFGGYTGNVPFLGSLALKPNLVFIPIGMQSDDIHVQTTKIMCAKYGIQL